MTQVGHNYEVTPGERSHGRRPKNVKVFLHCERPERAVLHWNSEERRYVREIYETEADESD